MILQGRVKLYSDLNIYLNAMTKEMQDGQISKEIPLMFEKLILILNNSFDQITNRNQKNIENNKLEIDLISDEVSKINTENSSPSKNLLLNDVQNNIEIINSDVDNNSNSSKKVGDSSILVIPSVLLSLSQSQSHSP